MRRNVTGQFVGAQMITAADGTAFTGSVTVYVTGNAGTQAVGSVGSGACTHEGNGFHSYAPAQAETNYTHVAFTFIGTGAIPATVQIYPTAYDANGRADLGAISGSAVSTSSAQLGVNVVNAAGTAWGSGAITAGSIATGALTAAKFASGAFDAVWSVTTRLLTAGTNIVLAKGTGVTGFNDIAATAVVSGGAITTSGGAVSTVTNVTNQVTANTTAISGDTVAADNLEAMLDGTGGTTLTTAISGNITGNLSGSVGSVTGSVGSVTGAVGSVTGAVGSVTGNVGGNVVGSVASVTGAVGSVTGNVGGNVTGSVGSLGTTAKSDVNAEVVDALSTDTYGEPTGVPGATVSLAEKIGRLYMALRNQVTVTATKKTYYDDGGSAEWEKDLSDDGTTYTETEGNAI